MRVLLLMSVLLLAGCTSDEARLRAWCEVHTPGQCAFIGQGGGVVMPMGAGQRGGFVQPYGPGGPAWLATTPQDVYWVPGAQPVESGHTR